MLTIFTDGRHRTCQGYTRREMLQVLDLGELRVASGLPSEIITYLGDSQPILQLA